MQADRNCQQTKNAAAATQKQNNTNFTLWTSIMRIR